MESAAQARHPGLHPELLHDRETCGCVRCTGFTKGHKVNVGRARDDVAVHGAFRSPLVLRPEAEAIAELVRPFLPVPYPGFEGTLQSYCISLARIQRAHNALEDCEARLAEDPDWVPPFNPIALGDYLMRWQSSARKDAAALGLTPESAAKIRRDAEMGAFAQQAALTLESAQQLSDKALRKMRLAIDEALADTSDTIDG